MSRPTLAFDTDGRDWPNRESSRFVEAAGLRWHVQVAGDGPDLLLVHGTGAATHSFAGLLPLLAARFRVIAPDLPGHGFTDGADDPAGRTLPGMAGELGALLAALGASPALAVGHSAGAAILARMTLDGIVAPRGIVSINGAFIPFRGVATQFFSPIAKLLALNPLVPLAFAWRASDPSVVERLLANTGSHIPPHQSAFYARLAGNPAHVSGALGMMAAWDLRPLEQDLPRLAVPLLLLAAANDGTVSPGQAYELRSRVPVAEVMRLRGVGHLAHEEKPDMIAGIVIDAAGRFGVFGEPGVPASGQNRRSGKRST